MAGLETQYYVYLHHHPETKEVVYVGFGQGQRAWMMRNSGGDTPQYGHRKKAHWEWYKELELQGFTLDEIVSLQVKNVSQEKARKIEKHLIGVWNPKFNVHKGKGSMTNPQLVKEARELRDKGLSYLKIAKDMELKSAMTAWRYVNAAI